MNGPLYTADEIYALLPALYRVRDVEQGGVLRELVEVVADQVNALAEGLEQTYDDQFVETCADWIAPYIGDLVGYRTLHGSVASVASPRAEVANTVRYRRRKGTIFVVEDLARAVTGWPARAVEEFEHLVTTQFMNHVRGHAAATASMRDAGALELGGGFEAGAFDGLAHTAEMRGVASRSGRWNIPNIAIFLWRVLALRLEGSPLVPADASGRRYRFDALGADMPLFHAPRTEVEITHIAEPIDLPIPLTVRWLGANRNELYGAGRTLELAVATAAGVAPIGINSIRICNLADDPATPGAWAHEPQPGDKHVVIDPVLGRAAFPVAPAAGETRLATFHYGSALEVGGGGYDRSESIDAMQLVVPVDDGDSAALAAALVTVAPGGVVEIEDSRRYDMPAFIGASPPAAGNDAVTVLRSANRRRPVLLTPADVRLAMAASTSVVLDGVVLAGGPLVLDQQADTEPRTLILRHCTLVPGVTRTATGGPGSPGVASLIVLHPFATVILEHCVTGPIVAVDGATVTASDCVVDACAHDAVAFCGRAAPAGGGKLTVNGAADYPTGDGLDAGGHLTLDGCTVVGKVHAQRLDASNTLLLARLTPDVDEWPAPVWARRRQVGCVRFSFVPPGSRTPRRFQCAGDDPAHQPNHTSLRYGDPGYGQLRRSTHAAIRTGADDENAIGVTHALYEPQRETNLRLRLDEYLRFGLQAGFFYAS